MEIVFDASTLILLAKIELLREITEEVKVIIPEKVNPDPALKRGALGSPRIYSIHPRDKSRGFLRGGVKAECLSKKTIDAILISTLIKEKKIEVKKAGNAKAVKKIQRDFRIEAGEAEALWLARRLNCPIAVDDGPTIKACKVIGQRFATAIHFLLNLASQDRLELSMAIAKLGKLSHYGRYSREIIKDATERLKGGN